LTEEYFDSIKEAKLFLKSKMKSKECFIVVEGSEVLGVMAYIKDYSHYANFLSDITVSRKHRGKGVAKELLKKFIEMSRKEQPKKQPFALSSTVITNKKSIKMHLNFGFKEIGRIKKLHYGKDEIFFGYKIH